LTDTIDVHHTRDARDDDLINDTLTWRRYDTSNETPVIDEETATDTRDGAWYDAPPPCHKARDIKKHDTIIR
jgi:hypothetical protein